MPLRPYQIAALEAIKTRLAAGVSRQLVALPTGTGKTVIFASIPKLFRNGKRMLFLVHREELAQQAADKLRKWNPELSIGIEMATERSKPTDELVVASVATIGRVGSPRLLQFKKEDFSAVVVDECFPAGTLIDGSPIEGLKVGDLVTSFNDKDGQLYSRRVLNVFKRRPESMMKVAAGGISVNCTQNHPFFTNRGWVSAKNLTKDDWLFYDSTLQDLQQTDEHYKQSAEASRIRTLQPRMLQRSSVNHDGGNQPQVRFGANESQESDGQSLHESTNGSHVEENRTQAVGARREWDGSDKTGEASFRSCGLAIERSGEDENAAWLRVSNSVQTGLGLYGGTFGCRSGRLQSRSSITEETRPEKGSILRIARVDDIEIYEPTSDGTFGGVCPDGFVYNIEVEEHHTYTANGFVVHNCHHSTAQSYLTIFDHFGLRTPDNKILLAGFTATPNRGDGTPLAKVYDEIVYQMTILDAIRQGWLVNLRALRVSTKTNLDDVHILGGDFQQNELAKEVNTQERNDVIVRKWLEHAREKSTVVFTVDIAHAKALADCFKRYGVSAEAIWGDDSERGTKLSMHRKGHLRVLCNCGILTEGYDDPNIGCIVLARPTKSGLLFVQMAGRGTRLPEGVSNLKLAKSEGISLTKEDCLIMDVVDNTSKHSLVTINSIFGLGKQLNPAKMTITELVDKTLAAKLKNPNLDLDKVQTVAQLETTVSEVDLWKVKFPEDVISNSLLQWHQNTQKDSYVLLLPSKSDDKRESMAIVPNLLGTYTVFGSANGNKIKTPVADLPTAFRTADQHVSQYAKEHVNLLKREAKWHDEPVTMNQVRLLNKLRIPIPEGLTKGDAQKKIAQALARKGASVWTSKAKTAATKQELNSNDGELQTEAA